ncbi:MAG: amino acid racemase [Peptostreptococcaceae bacterium]|nr:amino acid racemase [Peptostreptococcaceae bacterium]
MSTKTLGVIGGMGPQASSSFYDILISNTKAEKDQDHIDVLLYSHASIPDRTKAILSGTSSEVVEKLVKDIKKMEHFGVDLIVLTCNTSHLFINDLEKEASVPIISMIDETTSYLIRKKIKRVGLLATDGTIRTGIYTDKLEAAGIEVLIPETKNQHRVMSIIYDQVKKGLPVDDDLFAEISQELIGHEVEAIILGCTELSYYGTNKGLDDFFVNPQEILAKECILRCGGQLVER